MAVVEYDKILFESSASKPRVGHVTSVKGNKVWIKDVKGPSHLILKKRIISIVN